jgi:hypothetical protein
VTYQKAGILQYKRSVGMHRYLARGSLITRVAVWKRLRNRNKVELIGGNLQSIGKELS